MTLKTLVLAALLPATMLQAEQLVHLQTDKIESLSIAAITNEYPALTAHSVELSNINLTFRPSSKGKSAHYYLASFFDIVSSAKTLPDGAVESERLQVVLSPEGEVELIHRSPVVRSRISPHPGTSAVTSATTERTGSRSFSFANTPVFMVIDTYEEVTDRKVALGRWAHVPLTVHAQNLNEKQVATAIETALGKVGIGIRRNPDGSYALVEIHECTRDRPPNKTNGR